ncbi:DEAD/DEAH box helicase, partial [Bifidobacteriaceae bacterium NR015]
MPHTHHAAFAQKRGAKNTKNVKNTRKSAEKRNPFEYQGSHKNYGSNHEFNSRRERNRKAEKARQKAREKALRYEEVAIADAEQDFAKNNVDKNNVAKNNIAKSNNEKQNSAISLRSTSKKQKQDSHNATIIPDSAIESRENYRDDVTFAQLGVPEPLVEVLRADGKTTAFPIQQATLPDSLQGANILGRGRTGSGKTLAFSIPLVARLAENFVDLINSGKNRKSRESSDIPAPRAIILAPTRELVHQIDDVIAP